jgi:hypothetical protein
MSKSLKIILVILGAISFLVIFAIIFAYQLGRKSEILSDENVNSVAIVYDCYRDIDRYTNNKTINGNSYKYHHFYKYKFNNKVYLSEVLDDKKFASQKNNKFLVVISKQNPGVHCVIFTKKLDLYLNLGDTISTSVETDELQENLERQDVTFSEASVYDRDDLVIKMSIFLGIGALIILIGWLLYGIDLKKGNIHIVSHPPKDLSPALLNSIADSTYNQAKIFTYALLSLGEKGFLKIDLDSKEIKLLKPFPEIDSLETSGANSEYNYSILSAEEITLLNFLYTQHDSNIVRIPKKYAEKWSNCISQIKKDFSSSNYKKYFLENTKFLFLGGVFHVISIYYCYQAFFFNYRSFLFIIGLFIFYAIMSKLLKKYTSLGRETMDNIEGYIAYLKQEDKLFLSTQEGKDHTRNFITAHAINEGERWFLKIKDDGFLSNEITNWFHTQHIIDAQFVSDTIKNLGEMLGPIMKKPNED